jgi:ATP-dependent DNA helicase
MQAQDRCHRFGQTRPVVVYRMVTAGTVDQKIVERAAQKRRLEKMIIHKGVYLQYLYEK